MITSLLSIINHSEVPWTTRVHHHHGCLWVPTDILHQQLKLTHFSPLKSIEIMRELLWAVMFGSPGCLMVFVKLGIHLMKHPEGSEVEIENRSCVINSRGTICMLCQTNLQNCWNISSSSNLICIRANGQSHGQLVGRPLPVDGWQWQVLGISLALVPLTVEDETFLSVGTGYTPHSVSTTLGREVCSQVINH